MDNVIGRKLVGVCSCQAPLHPLPTRLADDLTPEAVSLDSEAMPEDGRFLDSTWQPPVWWSRTEALTEALFR